MRKISMKNYKQTNYCVSLLLQCRHYTIPLLLMTDDEIKTCD